MSLDQLPNSAADILRPYVSLPGGD
jgi:hypothetical protein